MVSGEDIDDIQRRFGRQDLAEHSGMHLALLSNMRWVAHRLQLFVPNFSA